MGEHDDVNYEDIDRTYIYYTYDHLDEKGPCDVYFCPRAFVIRSYLKKDGDEQNKITVERDEGTLDRIVQGFFDYGDAIYKRVEASAIQRAKIDPKLILQFEKEKDREDEIARKIVNMAYTRIRPDDASYQRVEVAEEEEYDKDNDYITTGEEWKEEKSSEGTTYLNSEFNQMMSNENFDSYIKRDDDDNDLDDDGGALVPR